MTIALGYLKRLTGRKSSLMVVLIRRVHVIEDDRDAVGLAHKVDKLVLTAAINRELADSFRVEPWDALHIQSFYSFASVAKMFIAAHMAYQLPLRIQDTLFGQKAPILRQEQVKLQEGYDIEPIYQGMDRGGLSFLTRLSQANLVNVHQYESLVIVLN